METNTATTTEGSGVELDLDGAPVTETTGTAAAPLTGSVAGVFVHPRDRFPVVSTGMIELKPLIFDEDLQSRAKINDFTVAEYAETIKLRIQRKDPLGFPPIDVFRDPETGKMYVAGGFHRGKAHKIAKVKEILANVRIGTKSDAQLFAAAENTDHGLQRSQKDKVRALKLILDHPDAVNWTNTDIGRAANVSESMVRDYRPVTKAATKRKVVMRGKETVIDVSNLGKGKLTEKAKAAKSKAAKASKGKASSGTKSEAGDGSSPVVNSKGKPVMEFDAEAEKAMKRIVKALGDTNGPAFEEAVRTGVLEMSRPELLTYSHTSADRILRTYDLVSSGTKPSRAFALIDQEVTDKTPVVELKNLALGGKDSMTMPDLNKLKYAGRRGHYEKTSDGFIIVVLAPEKK